MSDAFLFLRALKDFSGEIVLAHSELFVYVDQFLAGVLKEETALLVKLQVYGCDQEDQRRSR